MFYCREGKVHITKESKEGNYGPPKKAVYNTTVWAEINLLFDELRESFKGDKPLKRKVIDDMYLVSSIWEKNGVRYSGVHKLNKLGDIIPGTGINLDNYEWNNVMRRAEEIDILLYGEQARKGLKRRSPDCEVEVWSYRWVLNGEELPVVPDNLEFYFESEARNHAEMNKPTKKVKKDDTLELKVQSEMKPRPDEILQMKMALISVVKRGIDWCRVKFCDACQHDPPALGQKAHMKGMGCLCPKTDFVTKYAADVYSAVTPEDLVTVYNTVCRWLGVSPKGALLLAKGALAWIPTDLVDTIIRKMSNYEFDQGVEIKDEIFAPENQSLLTVVRGTVVELNVQEKVGIRMLAGRV